VTSPFQSQMTGFVLLKYSAFSSYFSFPNARGAILTRDGVNYILQQAVHQAVRACPSLKTKRVSPYLLRHTCALHLLQSGVDISVIALWLGHENIQTTHGYIEADLALKERALQKVTPAGQSATRFKADDAPHVSSSLRCR
jgi:integrase/recombinase XerD